MERSTQPDYMTSRLATWRRWTDLPLTVLAVGSLPILALELIRSHLISLDRNFLNLMNVLVLVAFAVDYFVELSVARPRASYVPHEWASALIVVTQALALIPGLAGFGILRVTRAGRLLRFLVFGLRLFAVGGVMQREGRALLRKHAVALALGLAAFTWLMSAVLFTFVEDVGRGGRIHSFFDALWWSFGTMTTVGGELFPVTAAGRIVGGFTTLVGLAAFGVLTAKAAEFLVRADSSTDEPAGVS